MRYQRIAALVDAEVAEVGAALLAQAGFAIEILDETTLEKPPPGKVGLVVYAEGEETGARVRVEAALAGSRIVAEVSTAVSDEETWRDAWKAYFKPRPVGPFVLVPSWETYPASDGEITISLDPGRAFGTGGHASTRLCLRAIGAIASPVRRFLDVGCGSGLLAIGCARRWASATGVAIDVDPEAVDVTVENAAKNGVGDRVVASATPLAEVAGQFDLVLANIQADVIGRLAEALVAHLAPAGFLVVSGILTEQEAEVVAGLRARGDLIVAAREVEDEWSAVTLQKAAR